MGRVLLFRGGQAGSGCLPLIDPLQAVSSLSPRNLALFCERQHDPRDNMAESQYSVNVREYLALRFVR